MSDSRLTVLNDTILPTRVENSIERDTSPDLTWYRGDTAALWDKETLGSDHCILHTTLTYSKCGMTPDQTSQTNMTR